MRVLRMQAFPWQIAGFTLMRSRQLSMRFIVAQKAAEKKLLSCCANSNTLALVAPASGHGRLHVTNEETMPAKTQPRTSRDKVRAHRQRLREQGLRPIQIWVPDMRSPSFARQAHRQSAAVATSRYARRDQEFIDAISEERSC